MGKEIILAKIAKLAYKEQTSSDSKLYTFVYKNKVWIPLEAFKEDATNIFQLIEACEKQNRKDVTFTPTDEGQHLAILYRNDLVTYYECIIDQLLTIVYSNFKKPTSTPVVVANKVLNTYITTHLFEALQLKHNEKIQDLTKDMQQKLLLPDKFLPHLCEYQKKGVLWLLKREINREYCPAFFEKLLAKDNETVVYKYIYSRFIQTEPPEDILLPPGGILADEMGLGKTVEMLALILLNPRMEINVEPAIEIHLSNILFKRRRVEKSVFCICNSNSKYKIIQCQKCNLWQHEKCVAFGSETDDDKVNAPYLCPNCWQHVIQECGILKTKATLIVSPNTIKMQWVAEIQSHIKPSLKVFVYDGVLSGKWVSPRRLAEYDIVVTDYNILRGDTYFTQDNISERTTRNKPRYMRCNTPILMLEWWRVLLDEAQMVESNTSKIAALVRTIPAINRWAVTGTPIQKSLNDLRPLLQFIGFEAVTEPSVWHHVVNDFVVQHDKNVVEYTDGTCPTLISILQKCMWRTCKAYIASELEIPPQQEIVHRIQFNNLEKLFYNEQHAKCQSKFLENVFKYSNKMSTISPQIMNIILQPFLKIRQSCTIPVVAHNNLYSQQQKQFLQPEDLHDYLKSTNEISCKAQLRAMASSHNGLAGLYLLQKNFSKAIQNYEAVLKLANDYTEMNIAVDSLLQIHALHNIIHIKIMQNDKLISNLESYENQYNKLEWKYLSTYATNLAAAKNAYEAAIEKIHSEIRDNFLATMMEGLQMLSSNDESSLMQKLHEECLQKFGCINIKLQEIQSTATLLFVVQFWYEKLSRILITLQNDVKKLNYFYENVQSRNQVSAAIWGSINQLVNSVYDCHLSEIRDVQTSKSSGQKPKTKIKGNLCIMCCLRNTINEFECLLFDKVIDKNAQYTEGLENPSFEMFLCKFTFHFIKNKHQVFDDIMKRNWLYLENLQLACKRLIKFWIEMEYTIKAYDELNMCKMRITLTENTDDKSIYKIMKNDIESRIVELRNELMTAQNIFANKMARLRYIKHLESHDDPGPCPICQLTGNDKYAVLECGHHICLACLKSVQLYVKGSNLKCSICRNIQRNENIYYVSREKIKTTEGEKINGHYSSKITYIVSLILKLKRQQTEQSQNKPAFEINTEENTVKILIFSQWEPIIQAIALALKENNIKYRAQCTPKTIEEFKNPKLGITCLLMPFVKGSKGLNLVEATHVFLVEPILNPGEELQAIGRVHRIGQKRSTIVHRFIVSQTIEENIYNFIVSSSDLKSTTNIQRKWEFDNISLSDFENLFSLPKSDEGD